ncbi:MAG: 30S ribosomal protein S12 methylthiotransferase RimO, partial [Pigmentiphaga sp.]|nr:30S ribosomal protein S12 methylthiotransferase RimO [Pigmentiphaga sp.]
ANELPDPVPDEVRQERQARFMEVQQAISRKRLTRKVGKVLKCLVDEVTPEGGVARSMADAPDIDGKVYVAPADKPWKRYKVGDIISVRIARSDDYDLWGTVA